jgi:hypothetical protein
MGAAEPREEERAPPRILGPKGGGEGLQEKICCGAREEDWHRRSYQMTREEDGSADRFGALGP